MVAVVYKAKVSCGAQHRQCSVAHATDARDRLVCTKRVFMVAATCYTLVYRVTHARSLFIQTTAD